MSTLVSRVRLHGVREPDLSFLQLPLLHRIGTLQRHTPGRDDIFRNLISMQRRATGESQQGQRTTNAAKLRQPPRVMLPVLHGEWSS